MGVYNNHDFLKPWIRNHLVAKVLVKRDYQLIMFKFEVWFENYKESVRNTVLALLCVIFIKHKLAKFIAVFEEFHDINNLTLNIIFKLEPQEKLSIIKSFS